MVEIREESSESHNNNASNGAASSSSANSRNTGATPAANITDYLKANVSDVVCFLLRVATVYFALGYILPISSPVAQKTAYMKAFVAAAATNAFRLHQRLKGSSNTVFSRMFLMELLFEDSAHYLFYSLIFALSTPVTMALVPITLYALLHGINFCRKLADVTGHGRTVLALKAGQLMSAQNTANLLSMIACAEIAVMPIFIAMCFVGKANIFFPFIYYRFISMRYLSRRNPYTRQTFANLKVSLYRIAGHGSCPGIGRTIIYKAVALCERICPQAY